MESDRRKHERFTLELPAALKVDASEDGKRLCHLVTRDVSAAGAFFRTVVPLPVDSRLRIEFSLAVGGGAPGAKRLANVEVKGRVVRHDPGGMAVAFYNGYLIERVHLAKAAE